MFGCSRSLPQIHWRRRSQIFCKEKVVKLVTGNTRTYPRYNVYCLIILISSYLIPLSIWIQITIHPLSTYLPKPSKTLSFGKCHPDICISFASACLTTLFIPKKRQPLGPLINLYTLGSVECCNFVGRTVTRDHNFTGIPSSINQQERMDLIGDFATHISNFNMTRKSFSVSSSSCFFKPKFEKNNTVPDWQLFVSFCRF